MLIVFVEAEQSLNTLLEEALMNSSGLFELQKLYFNPKERYSPGLVCLSVTVAIGNVVNPNPDSYHYSCSRLTFTDDSLSWWQVTSYYKLQLTQAISDESGTSQLTNLLTKSGSTGVFLSLIHI